MAHIYRVVISFFFIFAISPAVHADGVVNPVGRYCDQYNVKCGTVSEIVAHWQAAQPTENCVSPAATLGLTWYAANVTDTGGDLFNKRSACPGYPNGRDSRQMGIYRVPGEACPANSSKVGDQCICDNSFKAEGGACVEKSGPRTADQWCDGAGFRWNAWKTDKDRTGVVKSASGSLPLDQPFETCMPMKPADFGASENEPNMPAGCKHQFTPNMRYRMSDTEPWVYEGDSWAIGAGTPGIACLPADDPKPGSPGTPGDPPIPRKDPQGPCKGIPGQVNGVDVCLDPSSGKTQGVDWTRVSDKDGNTVERKTQVDCSGEKCTVKTTTTGGSSSGGTTTSTTTRGAYCAENPKSAVCKGSKDDSGSTRGQDGGTGRGPNSGTGNGVKGNGKGDGEGDESSFGGSCASNFTCKGDAIQCAIAQEQHKRACKLFDDKSPESELYDKNKGKQGDQTKDLPGNDKVNLNGSTMIDTSDVLGGGSCITDKSVTVWNRTVTLPFSQICPNLAMFGNLLVAISMLLAMRIVSRG